MKIVLTDSRKVSQFACILRHLKDMSSDIMISIDENRLYTQGMDSSHAALFELNLSKDWFGEFKKVFKNESLSSGSWYKLWKSYSPIS